MIKTGCYATGTNKLVGGHQCEIHRGRGAGLCECVRECVRERVRERVRECVRECVRVERREMERESGASEGGKRNRG